MIRDDSCTRGKTFVGAKLPPGKLLCVEAFGARATTSAVHESGKHRPNHGNKKGAGEVSPY